MGDPLAPNTLIDGRYRLEAMVGEGGYGAVWRADDLETGRQVAVKFLKDSRCGESACRIRFVRENEVLQRLRHPNLARWVDGHPEAVPRPHLVMDWVRGVPLQLLLVRIAQRGLRISAPRALRWASDLTRGLGHAHAAGIVHRDLKPANVIWDPDADRLVIVDFGSARWNGEPTGRAPNDHVIGTTSYLAPELLRGERADPASDQFALATLLFEVLSLSRPWLRDECDAPWPVGRPKSSHRRNAPTQVFLRIQRGPRPSLRTARPELAPSIDPVLERAWHPDPNRRFRNVASFFESLSDGIAGAVSPSEAPTRVAVRRGPLAPSATGRTRSTPVERPPSHRRIPRASAITLRGTGWGRAVLTGSVLGSSLAFGLAWIPSPRTAVHAEAARSEVAAEVHAHRSEACTPRPSESSLSSSASAGTLDRCPQRSP
jgi:serine/threonine-protein kinase